MKCVKMYGLINFTLKIHSKPGVPKVAHNRKVLVRKKPNAILSYGNKM